jgi:hypothetical protein
MLGSGIGSNLLRRRPVRHHALARSWRGRQYIRDLPRASGCPGRAIKSGCLAKRSSGRLAGAAVLLDLEVDFLAFNEVRHASALDSGDVDENVRAAVVRLNEAEALGAVEPLNGASSHMRIP